MKHQVVRLSPHQNGKVFAVLMAAASLIFVVPFVLLAIATSEQVPDQITVLALVPVIYLIFGYLGVAASCLIYNWMFKFIGGIEYESQKAEA